MCPLPHYYDPIEYDAKRNVLTLRGFSFQLEPYAIEVRGPQARVWMNLLNTTAYFHRKANGKQLTRKLDDTTEYSGGEGDPEETPQGDESEEIPETL